MSSEADEDVLFKEIQASIEEGRMMLPVLRSLPPSENNTALISLFEELIARLENYRPQGRQNLNQSDVETQLNILKEKQERIRSLLTETARGLQASSSTSQPPTLSHTISGAITDSPAELVEQFKAWLAENRQSDAVPHNDTNTEQLNRSIPNSHAENEPPSSMEVKQTIASLNWNVQFAAQVSKLNDLLEDTRRFEGMAARLLDITRRAHLHEPSEFLEEIAMRFGELRKSFTSLRENYENLGADPQLTDKLREIQLVTSREFCSKLDQNLESTKECFFTIYHLVKSNIERGMLDGSLQETEGDSNEVAAATESTEQVEQTEAPQTPVTTDNGPVTISESATTPTATEASLAAQHAYLAELQGQTRAEQEEIRRLLRQRDELAARLKNLREAAANSLACETGPSSAEQPADVGQEIGSSIKQPSTLSRLEAKQRELQELKSQLALLRTAEQKVATLASNPNQSDLSRPLNAVREFLNAVSPSSDSNERNRWNAASDGDTVRFQQPEVTQLNGIGHSVSTAEVAKLLRTSQVGAAASVAASQDRTTLATWGGSSPMAPSSSASSSSVVDGQSPDGIEVYGTSAPKRATAPPEPTAIRTSVQAMQPPQTLLLNDSNAHQGKDTLLPSSAERMTMPQVGHSPSPSAPRPYPPQLDGDHVNMKGEVAGDPVEERFQKLENVLGQVLQLCRCLMLENSRLNVMLTQSLAHSSQTVAPRMTVNPTSQQFIPQPQVSAAPNFQWDTSAQQPVSHGWPSQSSEFPAKFSTVGASQDMIQNMWAQLMQQQANYIQLQNEFQRLLRQQLGGQTLRQANNAPWRISSPMPSQPMSPTSSLPASIIHPLLPANPSHVAHLPALNPWFISQQTVSVPPHTSVPNGINGFALSIDPISSNFMSPTSSVHEPFNLQSNLNTITELFNQLWNPPSSTTPRTGFL